MKYAVLSDIHGNYPALRAALADAREQGAEHYLFLGDYFRSFPWPNEVVETIRNLEPATVIRGNNEEYLPDLHRQDQSTWTSKQFGLLYWNVRTLSPENLDYLTSLPATALLVDDGCEIHLRHSLGWEAEIMHPYGFRRRIEQEPFSHAEFLARGREDVLSSPDTLALLARLPKGVILSGHNHLQFYMEYDGRWLVNPGSCGEACDCDSTAAYTLLERVVGGWTVIERRVAYDVQAVAAELRASSLASAAPAWSREIEKQLLMARDHFFPFLSHVEETGRRFGQTDSPVSNEIWDIAINEWENL